MNNNPLRVFCERARLWGDRIHVRMGRRSGESEWAVALPIQWKVVPDTTSEQDAPCFELKRDEAQALMDELWNVGFRPTEGTGSAGAMAAVQAHLKDLQKLVFKEKK